MIQKITNLKLSGFKDLIKNYKFQVFFDTIQKCISSRITQLKGAYIARGIWFLFKSAPNVLCTWFDLKSYLIMLWKPWMYQVFDQMVDKYDYKVKDEKAFGKIICSANSQEDESTLNTEKPCIFEIVPKGMTKNTAD